MTPIWTPEMAQKGGQNRAKIGPFGTICLKCFKHFALVEHPQIPHFPLFSILEYSDKRWKVPKMGCIREVVVRRYICKWGLPTGSWSWRGSEQGRAQKGSPRSTPKKGKTLTFSLKRGYGI